MGRSSKHDVILDTAENLFSVQGFIATGINQITEDAGVAPMTLYNNFKNKNELILATLERRSDRLLLRIETEIDKAEQTPQSRIISVFDTISSWIDEELQKPAGFTGCMFLKAAHEYTSDESLEREAALKHKKSVIAIFERELSSLNGNDAKSVALSLQLLLDGAITQAQLFKDKESANRARQTAELLLTILE